MSFLETPRFPSDISYGSKGGPVYNTTVVTVDSGFEKRNINWQYPLHQYDVSYGVRDSADLYTVLEFFHVAAGRGHGFRYKDWTDYKSTEDMTATVYTTPYDQVIGTGDGSTTVFQLKKTYSKGVLSRERQIKKPVSATVSVAVSGVEVSTGGFSVAYASGTVTFVSAPATGVAVTAGFQFDVPVRFDSDVFELKHDQFELQSTQIMLSETRR